MAPPGSNPPPPDPRAVADAYGLGRPRGAPSVAARGALGRIWRLETTSGTWAVKELLRYEAESVDATAVADVAFQEAALAAGVPMPHPILARSGDVLTDVGTAGEPRLVRVYTWVDLASRDIAPDLAEVAGILGRLHGLGLPDDRPRLEWFTAAPPAERWPVLLAEVRASAPPWLDAFEALVPAVVEAVNGTLSARAAPAITCHLDYNPENVLVDVRGHPVVVDWENSGPGSAEQELASVVAEFVADPARTEAFLAAYEDAGGPARLVDRSSFAMTAVVQANLVEAYGRWALGDATPDEDRAIAVHFIQDIAANVFTIARIDAWLDAAVPPPLSAGGRGPQARRGDPTHRSAAS
jgi:Ser/Thr protein kinase RdoA (MazF antagonist)